MKRSQCVRFGFLESPGRDRKTGGKPLAGSAQSMVSIFMISWVLVNVLYVEAGWVSIVQFSGYQTSHQNEEFFGDDQVVPARVVRKPMNAQVNKMHCPVSGMRSRLFYHRLFPRY
ncbi:MAG TPA: hypothetical protein GXZ47_06800 [Treponema sp.]|nr:hypothetical protein [Treponema sp.]